MSEYDDQITTELAVIDATLAGEPVPGEHAELAELSLLLVAERPVAEAEFTQALDTRVARRFAEAPAASPGQARAPRRWLFAPAGALALAAGVALAFVFTGGQSGPGVTRGLNAAVASTSSTTSAAAGSSAQSGNRHSAAKSAPSARSTSSSAGSLSLGPPPNGRQVIQSAQLALATRPSGVDGVAQQVFDVVGAQDGYVQSSSVTATGSPNGYAQFRLSIPSANLAAAMSALSRLRGATVTSRTDTTQDVTGQMGGDQQRLGEARALRTSLLRQLAGATTTEQVNSLEAQIHDADASIASDLSTLRSLQHRVAYTQVSVTISATLAAPPHHSSGGFTLGRAAHDAGRVLVVVAGGALIVLAALVPVGLVVALAAWVGFWLRRRRREQALDLV
jgi:hypothetical protein